MSKFNLLSIWTPNTFIFQATSMFSLKIVVFLFNVSQFFCLMNLSKSYGGILKQIMLDSYMDFKFWQDY